MAAPPRNRRVERIMSWVNRGLLFVAMAGASALAPAGAQEITAMGGVLGTGAEHGTTYSWQLDYRRRWGDRFAWSASWINEGHTTSHHRDGLAAQAWMFVLSEPQGFSLALGAGGYRYADTHFLAGGGFTNDHGLTPLYSIAATFSTDSPWLIRLTGNHIVEAGGLSTNALLVGVGYEIGRHNPPPGRPAGARRAPNTLTILAGRTIVNSRSSEQATARVVEYRRALGRAVDWTLSWLDEGDPTIMHREGIASQVWLVDAHRERRLGFGIGAGPYFVFERHGPPSQRADAVSGTALLLSPTCSCQLTHRWQARLTWNRVLSRNNRDADVIVLGVGYRWGGSEL